MALKTVKNMTLFRIIAAMAEFPAFIAKKLTRRGEGRPVNGFGSTNFVDHGTMRMYPAPYV
jgi:hypothetical protein